VATLSDLARARTDLDDAALAHLHRLLAEWQLVADVSFADLLLLAPQRAGGWVVLAQVRPVTGPTVYVDDLVGATFDPGDRPSADLAWAQGRIVREGDPVWHDELALREEAIPVRLGTEVIAVLARDVNVGVLRTPSALELAYMAAASDLASMISEGRLPFPGATDDLSDAPRVGDGLIRVDTDGIATFASPNAQSAFRRLGNTSNLVGQRLQDVADQLSLSLDAGGMGLDVALEQRRPAEGELHAARGDSAVRLRSIPLVPGGMLLGALVLLRDITEVRRRDRALLTKDATIREIHHRVKNNLQTVAALLRLQARRSSAPEARSALEESVRRVTSIALVHETLSQALDETVPFDSIADTIASASADLATTGSGRVRVTRAGSFGVLSAEVATPLALVLSELVANAVEHAHGGGAGQIEVRARRERSGDLEVIVADNGAGLPAGFSLERSAGLGLQIVRTLVVGELRGTVALRPGPSGGTEAVVAVPALSHGS
jgi:two-component sensor histidine kinase